MHTIDPFPTKANMSDFINKSFVIKMIFKPRFNKLEVQLLEQTGINLSDVDS